MREISPAINMSADEFLATKPKKAINIAETIREEKKAGRRPLPSSSLIDKSELLNPEQRSAILDQTAFLVDENLFGRSEMCIQFSLLLDKALKYFGLDSRCCVGIAICYDEKKNELFRWDHMWVRVGDEVVDGNTDILYENPMIPKIVEVGPYWGPINKIPSDRRLRENHGQKLPSDEDVDKIWWPDLLTFLEENFPNANHL